MNEARQKFEALLAVSGRERPLWDGHKYTSKNVQTYWRYFYLGWTMKGDK